MSTTKTIPADARWEDDGALTFERMRPTHPPAKPERPEHREYRKSRAGEYRHA